MAHLKKYDLSGKEVEKVVIDDALLKTEANSQMIKDYLVAIQANKRQWSAKTKDRSEVRCSGFKPHPQKGTGRARQGSLAAPQYRGGGVVFGPRPKFDQKVRINKKEKRGAIRSLFTEKIHEGKLAVLGGAVLSEPKTKTVDGFLKALSLKGKRVLFLAETPSESDGKFQSFILSLRNIPKVSFKRIGHISGYDLALYQDLIVIDSGLEELMKVLEGAV